MSEARPADPAVGDAPRVLVFFDYACPFCYLDWPRFKRLRGEYGTELFLVPFELRPGLPADGISAAELGAEHSERVLLHMLRMAEEAGLSYHEPEHIPNTHAALALGELARGQGPVLHEVVHEAIWSAYFGSEQDIGDRGVLLRIAQDAGLDPEEVRRAWAEGIYDGRLHSFAEIAASLGVSATPAALVCGELLVGTRPYSVLRASVERCMSRDPRVSTESDGRPGESAGTPPAVSGS